MYIKKIKIYGDEEEDKQKRTCLCKQENKNQGSKERRQVINEEERGTDIK
jgi:hypothetical protein